jgi:hypothetical protein
MKVAIIGSRDFSDYRLLRQKCNLILSSLESFTILSGGARGADRLAERYAREKGLPILIYKADWIEFGKQAGMIRNNQILLFCTHVIAFWDGKSPGTWHMIIQAKILGKKLRIVRTDTEEKYVTGAPVAKENPEGIGRGHENK